MRAWRRSLIALGYIGYALALCIGFLYLQFPAPEVHRLLQTALTRQGLEALRIGAVQPLWSAGVALRDIRYVREADGRSLDVVGAPELRLYMRTLVPFAKAWRLRFEGELYGGRVAGTVEWQRNGQEATVDLQAALHDLHPGAHPALVQLAKATVDGRLAGEMRLRIANASWQQGEGRVVLHGEAGRVAGLEVGGGQWPSLTYEQVSGEIVWQRRDLLVRDLLIRGRDWQFDLQGHMHLTTPLPASPLDLTVRVRASEPLEQQLGFLGTVLKQRRDRRGIASFRIGGTLGQPRVVL
jgi:type II secretion system protein N